MRTLLFSLLLLSFAGSAVAQPGTAGEHDAMVVLRVDDLDDAGMSRLAREAARQRNVSIEYSCTWSGVVVLKFEAVSTGDRADAITMARRLLSAAALDKGMEVLHVKVERRGTGKC